MNVKGLRLTKINPILMLEFFEVVRGSIYLEARLSIKTVWEIHMQGQ